MLAAMMAKRTVYGTLQAAGRRNGGFRGLHSWLNRLEDSDITALRSMFEGRCTTDADTLAPHNLDWMRQFRGASPIAIYPKTTEDVSALLKYCTGRRIGVVPQGGNTGLVGGGVPQGADEVILSLKNMNKIISFDPLSGVLVAESGCVLEQLDNFLAGHGYAMPLDLGAKGSCMIGGNVSTNAGGLRFLRYGSLHGSVLGLEAVSGDGSVIDALSSLKKDNVGFDLKQLLIGSEGCLGVVTKVAIQAVPRVTRQVAMLAVPTYDACARIAGLARSKMGEVLSAVEFVDGHAMSLTAGLQHGWGFAKERGNGDAAAALEAALPEDMRPVPMDELLASTGGSSAAHNAGPLSSPPGYYVVIEVGGSNPSHDTEKLHSFLDDAMTNQGLVRTGVVADNEAQANFLWRLREEVSVALGRRGHVFKYDLSFATPRDMYAVVEAARLRFIEHQPRMADAAAAKARPVGGDAEAAHRAVMSSFPVGYGHMFDGNVHLNITCPSRWAQAKAGASDEDGCHGHGDAASYHAQLWRCLEPWVFDWTIGAKGSISAEHGIGQAKAHYLPSARSPASVRLMAGLKKLMDPAGILNPGKVLEKPLA